MKRFGYIEGYYGKELLFDERKRIIDSLAENKLNSYIMGSKEDPYHRIEWRTTPPTAYQENLKELIAYGNERGVSVIPSIAPGLSYDYSDSDQTVLINRLLNFVEQGASTIALMMDDLPLELPEHLSESNISLGKYHGMIVEQISQQLTAVEILFCPTFYTDELYNCGKEANRYLEGLHKKLPQEVTIFWTGKNTIAESYDHKSCSTITDLFGDRVIFWDNIYANDYATTRLFVGPYEKRDHTYITEQTSGIMINPTGMIETDLFLLDIVGEWHQTGTSSIEQWKKIAAKNKIPQHFEPYLPWFCSPFSFPKLSTLASDLTEPLPFFNELIVQWQSPLKLEWYPYLHRFFTELKLHHQMIGEGPWFQQRFYPITASKLSEETTSTNYSVL